MSEQQTERFDGPSFEAKVRAIRILLTHWRQQEAPASVEGEPGGAQIAQRAIPPPLSGATPDPGIG